MYGDDRSLVGAVKNVLSAVRVSTPFEASKRSFAFVMQKSQKGSCLLPMSRFCISFSNFFFATNSMWWSQHLPTIILADKNLPRRQVHAHERGTVGQNIKINSFFKCLPRSAFWTSLSLTYLSSWTEASKKAWTFAQSRDAGELKT